MYVVPLSKGGYLSVYGDRTTERKTARIFDKREEAVAASFACSGSDEYLIEYVENVERWINNAAS